MKIYVVQWIRELFNLADGSIVNCDDRTTVGRSLPPRFVQAFKQLAAAECFRLECEAVRALPVVVGNPFHLGAGDDLSDLTSLPDKILGDWVREVGLEPPPKVRRPNGRGGHWPATPRKWEWAVWWRERCERMTMEQRARVYRALDRVNFLEIIELELEE